MDRFPDLHIGIPGFQMMEIPYRVDGLEVSTPGGDLLELLPGVDPKKYEGQWPDGSRLVAYVTTPRGQRLALAQWTWIQGKRVEEPEQIPDTIAIIFPDIWSIYCWDRYGYGTDSALMLEGVPGAERMEQAFMIWDAQFDTLSAEEVYAHVAPPCGWPAFEAEGLDLCRRFVTLMGPEGVVIYRRDYFSLQDSKPGIILYWEPQ